MKPTVEIGNEQSQVLLKALHILTRDGKLNQDSRRKLKQVNHLLSFMRPVVSELCAKQADFTIVDHGAGKSYLGFMLYDLLLKHQPHGNVIGVETRVELVRQSAQLAQQCGFSRMQFLPHTVAEAMQSALIPNRVALVTALHACDTATDDAIRFGLHKQAQTMVLVPCCQAEVAGVLRQHKAHSLSSTPLSELWRHAIHTREFGSHLTNVLRCLQLEAHGYQVTVTELVGWEHSMKNELILAQYTGQKRKASRERLMRLLEGLKLNSLAERFT